MNDDRHIFALAAELSGSGRPFVLITVIKTQGSTPRNAGAKMIYSPALMEREGGTARNGGGCDFSCSRRAGGEIESGAVAGTVGGGQFELLVMDVAATHLAKRTCGTERYVLGADADQCCGGVLEVFFEYRGPRGRLVIFGAGHVSQELAGMLDSSGLEIVIVDDRPEWNSAERFPRARRVTSWGEGVAAARENAARTLACVMTCSHDTDFDLLRKLLAGGAAEMPVFTGLIGSKSKRVCLFGRLVASGIDEQVVKRVQCPIGVGNTGKEPRHVAISMAAQLLMEARKLEPERV